jgi:hypothetical protein
MITGYPVIYDADVMTRLEKDMAWVGGLFLVAVMLVTVEASVGHDGLLCEWGFDSDGAAMGDSGCE